DQSSVDNLIAVANAAGVKVWVVYGGGSLDELVDLTSNVWYETGGSDHFLASDSLGILVNGLVESITTGYICDTPPDCPDTNGDGFVDLDDLNAVLTNFG